jgi:predicted GNAT family acetyltransferase
MNHILDRPIWNALLTLHAPLSEGSDLARRYRPDISLFAAVPDESDASIAALGDLAGPGETMLVLQAPEITIPRGLSITTQASVVQMIAAHAHQPIDDPRIAPLGWPDADDMYELAMLTKPGPFTRKALSLGDFWGIRIGGRLVAMAGERLKQPGLTELSGVCTHPDMRGQGLGRLMSLYVAGRIGARGEQAYLHAYETNHQATALYRSIGFERRQTLKATVMTRPA